MLSRGFFTLIILLNMMPMTAQDRYAANVKYDKNQAKLDSVIMQELIMEEEEEGDIYKDLYDYWSDSKVNPYGVEMTTIKDSIAIDCSTYYPPALGHVTSAFGPRSRSFHNGIDLKVKVGDTIRAAFSGKVRIRRYNKGGYGYYLVLRHKDNVETIYGHLSKFLVASNQEVQAGQPIALGGNTGRSTGSHLHFEVRLMGNPINPAKLFSFTDYVPLQDTYYVVKEQTFEERMRYSGIYITGKDGTANKFSKLSYYTVKKGDNLTQIAKKHGISVSALCKLNNIKPTAVIRPGQRLKLS